MNSRESASDLLRKALYALEASGHGGDPRCDARGDAEDGNIDGNHSFSDTAGASTSASMIIVVGQCRRHPQCLVTQ